MRTIFKAFIELVALLFLFYVLIFLANKLVGSELPYQGSNLHYLHWKLKS